MACRCNPCGYLKAFVYSERKAVSGDALWALHSAVESSAFLFGDRDASLVLWQIGHLAQYFIASWPASVLGGFTSSSLILNLWLSFSYFIWFRALPITLAWTRLCWGGARNRDACSYLRAKLTWRFPWRTGEGPTTKQTSFLCGGVSVPFSAFILGMWLQMCRVREELTTAWWC